MYEKQLDKLEVPVDFRTNAVFVPSYHEAYPLPEHLLRPMVAM